MGADRRMYPAPWADLCDFVAHDWPRHAAEQTLADVARSLCEIHGIRDGDAVIGTSLGGMVACEITKIRRIRALYLIASAIDKAEVSTVLATLHPLARFAPLGLIRSSAGKVPLELTQMFSGVEVSFVRAMCEAIFQWEGLGAPQTRVFRIHGRSDHVIPAPPQVDLLLDGGHLISMTHARECVAFIRANQTPEPTPMSVTPPAAQEPRQP